MPSGSLSCTTSGFTAAGSPVVCVSGRGGLTGDQHKRRGTGDPGADGRETAHAGRAEVALLPQAVRGDPAIFAAMAESERDYMRDKTREGQETARTKGKAIGGLRVFDHRMLATVPRLRDDERVSLREVASRLVIRAGKKRGRRPSPGHLPAHAARARRTDGHAGTHALTWHQVPRAAQQSVSGASASR